MDGTGRQVLGGGNWLLVNFGGAGVDDAVERTISPARLMFEPTGQLVEEQEAGRPCMCVSHTHSKHIPSPKF